MSGTSRVIHTLNFQFHLLMNQSQIHHYLLLHLPHHNSVQSCPTAAGFFVDPILQFNFSNLLSLLGTIL